MRFENRSVGRSVGREERERERGEKEYRWVEGDREGVTVGRSRTEPMEELKWTAWIFLRRD